MMFTGTDGHHDGAEHHSEEAHHESDSSYEHSTLAAHGSGHAKVGSDEYPVEWSARVLGGENKNKEEDSDMTEGFDSGLLAGLLGNRRDHDDYGMLAAMMAKQGIDPGIVAMLNDRCRCGDGWGDNGGIWIILIFLFIMMGGWGNGFGRNGMGVADGALGVQGIDRTIVNESNYQQLMEAVRTTGTRQEMAIGQLAQTLNCDNNTIRSALCGLDKQLALTQGDIKAAIQQCCCNIRTEVQAAAAGINQNIAMSTCAIQKDISGLNYNVASQFAAQTAHQDMQVCDLKTQMTAGFGAVQNQITQLGCDLEMRALKERNAQLERELAQASQNSQTALILQAINNRDTVAWNGTVDGTSVTGTGTIS